MTYPPEITPPPPAGEEEHIPLGSYTELKDEVYDWAGGGGGGGGAARLLGPFTFAFDTPNLNAGFAFYTPTIGDFLLDAWVIFTTAFNGTTPKFDCIDIYGDTNGAFYNQNAPVDATQATSTGSSLLTFGRVASSLTAALLTYAVPLAQPFAPLMSKVNQADPWWLWVSADGRRSGAAIGATQGAGELYLLVATPGLPA